MQAIVLQILWSKVREGNECARDAVVVDPVTLPKFLVEGSDMVVKTSLLVEELELTITYNGPVQSVITLTLM